MPGFSRAQIGITALLSVILWKHLLFLKIVPITASKFSVLASFPAIGHFSPVFTTYIECRKNPLKCTFKLAAFGTIFGFTGDFRNNYLYQWPESERRNNLTEEGSVRIFRIVSVVIEASKNLKLNFVHNKASQKFENYRRSFRKYWSEFEVRENKYSSRDTISLQKWLDLVLLSRN